jgi:DNA-binding transcriptional ArsR family regulator
MHPVRIRIVNAMSGGQALTTAQLCERLPSASQATVYRHVAALADGGILEIDGEERVGGAVERRYRLRRDRVAIEAGVGKSMSLDEHRRLFTASVAALIAEFEAYLAREHASPFDDSVSYRQTVRWLDEEELAAVIEGVRQALTGIGASEPSPGRMPYVMSTILFPAEVRAEGAAVRRRS